MRGNFEGGPNVQPIEKHWESLLLCMQPKASFCHRQWHESATAAAECNVPDWSVSQYIVLHKKIHHPVMWPFAFYPNSLTTLY